MEPAASPMPSYEALAAELAERDARIARQAVLIGEGRGKDARIVELTERLASQDAKIVALERLVAELAAKLGKDSQTSSKPPSSDGPSTRAERRRAERERRKAEPAEGAQEKKKRGGQAGHAGRGLEFSRAPDDVRVVEPAQCGGCGGALAGATQAAVQTLQVVDIPEVRALVIEYLLVSRRCDCGTVTKGVAPEGTVGAPVCYGPNLTAAALLLHTFGQLGQACTAEVVNGLFGTRASAGWINKIAARLAEDLYGFEADAKTALLTEDVLLADETPVNTIADEPEADGADPATARTFNPYVFTLRSKTIVWLGAGHTRGHAALDLFDLFGRYTGTLVTDDYCGYLKYETNLAARQLCNAHLIRSARGVAEAEPGAQAWAEAVIEVLRAGRAAVKTAEAEGREALEAAEIEAIRARCLETAETGITANRHRHTSKGDRHPGYVLAKRIRDKIDQILHHLSDFAVPWTSNLAEQALRHVKIHLKTSGCFRTLTTTRAYCRIHSYLITVRLHGIPPMQAIRDALAGNAWTPLRAITAV